MAGNPAAAVLELLTERLSSMESSSSDSNDTDTPSPSSAATSFELPCKTDQPQAPSSPQPQPTVQSQALATTPPLTFLTLPSDIHHLILTSYLPYQSIIALRSTSTQFHSLISPTTLLRLRQSFIAQLLSSERALVQKWLPQSGGYQHGRPTSHLTCYTCLQSLPTTSFFADQVGYSRGLGRKRASRRRCKACGLKYGKIRHGHWMAEVAFSQDDQLCYEMVMDGAKLSLTNPCVACPPCKRFDGQHVWWGCVGCLEQEEKRARKMHSERRRDVRRHLSMVKRGFQALVTRENWGDFRDELWWWMKRPEGWDDLRYELWFWTKRLSGFDDLVRWRHSLDESLLTKAARTCERVGRAVDPRKMREPGQKLGRKATRAVGAMLELTKKKKRGERCNAVADTSTASITSLEDYVLCSSEFPEPTTTSQTTTTPTNPTSPTSSPNSYNHTHIPAPRREVRCWCCWRPKRSRYRHRYDGGMVDGYPLPKERWCAGCQAEHERSVVQMRERRIQGREVEANWAKKWAVIEEVEEREQGGADEADGDKVDDGGLDLGLGLGALFGDD